eukprot:gnl/MRDRNA2_/MRDRNA2_50583_c0_seq1.p1 gnl/MRDRNA2_/MRDRNA2_50583_c0~~gnl/MRDRNA2_/MRDRNA2_50583_c0_seq1.p1  ORF type:complete len:139 (-),score=29.13 gnl/MRDRNA2_/MRDRNA2_50583_c0_seq1:200-616(-)
MEISTADKDIEQACRILTVRKYCQQQATELSRCQKEFDKARFPAEGLVRLVAGQQSSSSCAREESVFKSCATEHMGGITATLTALASLHCQQEVAEFQNCKARFMSDEACQTEDVHALTCAARYVIQWDAKRRQKSSS